VQGTLIADAGQVAGPCSVSVILCTFNRARQLRPAVEHLLAQSPNVPPFEVVVVDNNSTDDTRGVVEACRGDSNDRLRYVFEPRQGLSYARNTGIREAQADIVAFTDDDVRVASGWVEAIVRAFEAHSGVECLGGRTLPLWPAPPPAWLTPLHWVGPLALQDYGAQPFIVDARRPLSLAGANIAIRKAVFARVGPFSADYPRSEDTEFLIRFWLSGAQALYVPDMLVHADVQPERLTKAYHRQWHSNIGRCNARMLFDERSDPVVGLREEVPKIARVLGAPRFALRQLGSEVWQWMAATVARREPEAFYHETRARSLIGYMRESRRIDRRKRLHPARALDRTTAAEQESASAPALTRNGL
jgi:glycosyltransferase involved in cell wall biosynthesis